VIYDTFSVIGRVIAMQLGLPYVNVCAGHNVDPGRFVSELATDPRVDISPSCHRAVEVLRERYGVAVGSAFSYVSGLSPFLNVYCEPDRYLTEAERRVFEPVAFFGSLPSVAELEQSGGDGRPGAFGGDGRRLNVYISFGTVVWRYYREAALAALRSISASLAARPGVQAMVSLGRTELSADVVQELSRPNVSLASYVDQWRVLREADVFVTHNGMNSTHEAIFNRVPMISYPFFWDQPSLAAKCQAFGLSVPLVDVPRGPVSEGGVDLALDDLALNRARMCANLEDARRWELQVMAQRDAVAQRIIDLTKQS
jgi:hypothetical protein